MEGAKNLKTLEPQKDCTTATTTNQIINCGTTNTRKRMNDDIVQKYTRKIFDIIKC